MVRVQVPMHVVVIDDTDTNIILLKALLARLGDVTCSTFMDPVEGLEFVLSREPDLLIVDYMMPKLDGLQVVEAVRAKPSLDDMPILMVTAFNEREVLYKALEKGATDFLSKPMDRVEFSSRVRNMLALRKSYLMLKDRAVQLAVEVEKATALVRERERETIYRLAKSAEFRDPETGAHILRMAHYSKLVGRELGLSSSTQELLLQAAPMHDVGKLGTPDHILLKPGKLTPEEFEVMKKHAAIGYEILKGSNSPMLQMAAEIAWSHHERYDGSGYPRALKGEAIPLSGRIVALADVFDALTSNRPYKRAWSLDEAKDFMLKQRGAHFDPGCFDVFFGHWDEVVQIHHRFRDEQPSAYGPS